MQLKRHEVVHSGERSEEKCPLCDRTYTHLDSLRQHVRTAHPEQADWLYIQQGWRQRRRAKRSNRRTSFSLATQFTGPQCSVCGKRFSYLGSVSLRLLCVCRWSHLCSLSITKLSTRAVKNALCVGACMLTAQPFSSISETHIHMRVMCV